MAALSSAWTSSPTYRLRNSKQATSAPNYLPTTHPTEDLCKSHLLRSTLLLLQRTGEESTLLQSSIRDPADLAGTYTSVDRYDSEYWACDFICSLSFYLTNFIFILLSHLLVCNATQYNWHIFICLMFLRAFSAVAQIESDAILAGLLTTSSILSTQQMTKW